MKFFCEDVKSHNQLAIKSYKTPIYDALESGNATNMEKR